ncbi:TATA element modulatory factor-like, partial [Strongylocentrotus purpuratus]|uniref:Uncharacterized protein n=1 Tax=Strongylocentrotus purpuratus TaxID=7668 RepID=A0A7M7NMN3_STRPU
KLADMAQVLQAREAQALTLSNKNADLQEAVNILKSQLQQSEEARETEMTDLNQLTEEFTQRISSMEKKLQVSQKERDNLKKDVQKLNKEIASRSAEEDQFTAMAGSSTFVDGNNQTEGILKEKDETIRDLMARGETLQAAAAELQHHQEATQEQLDEATTRVSHLEEVLDGKEELEKQQKDIIKKMNSVVERQEKEISNLRTELEDSKEKTRSTQAALDASYKPGRVAQEHCHKDSQVQETQLSAEMNAKEELRLALERSQQEARRDHESLLLQTEQHQARKEGHLRQEISDLQMRLQEAEARNQELSQSVSADRKPEHNLQRPVRQLGTGRAQPDGTPGREPSQLASSTEKERNATECALIAESKLSSLESQLALLRQDKSRLQAGLEMERAKLKPWRKERRGREMVHTEAQISTYTKALEEAQRESSLGETAGGGEDEGGGGTAQAAAGQDALNEKERRLMQQTEDSNSSHGNHSEQHPGEESAQTPAHSTPQLSIAGGQPHPSLKGYNHSSNREKGRSYNTGEIVQLERTRASMAEEIVKTVQPERGHWMNRPRWCQSIRGNY